MLIENKSNLSRSETIRHELEHCDPAMQIRISRSAPNSTYKWVASIGCKHYGANSPQEAFDGIMEIEKKPETFAQLWLIHADVFVKHNPHIKFSVVRIETIESTLKEINKVELKTIYDDFINKVCQQIADEESGNIPTNKDRQYLKATPSELKVRVTSMTQL